MNAQPGQIDPEDVLQRMAREVGTLTAEKHIAESQRDAALRQVAELTEQVVAGQTQINALTAELTEANRERDAAIERFELAAGPNQTGTHVTNCSLDLDHKGGCTPGPDTEREGYGYP